MKIIDIQHNDPNKKTLIIAPPNNPTLLYKQFIESNSFSVTVCQTFPPPPNSHDIIIMTLGNFFEVERETLKNYDITKHNISVDDLQPLSLNGENNKCAFDDLVKFVELMYNDACDSDFISWFLMDIGQRRLMSTTHYLYMFVVQ